MSRPAKWNSPTTSIRVPAHTVEHLLPIARRLDEAPSVVQANGLVDGVRPTGSNSLSEEVERMAMLMFAGLSRYLEPEAFLKMALSYYACVSPFVQNSRIETQLLTIDNARYLLTYEPDDERLEPLVETIEARLTAAGLTRREDRLMFAVALAEEMERRGDLKRLEGKG